MFQSGGDKFDPGKMWWGHVPPANYTYGSKCIMYEFCMCRSHFQEKEEYSCMENNAWSVTCSISFHTYSLYFYFLSYPNTPVSFRRYKSICLWSTISGIWQPGVIVYTWVLVCNIYMHKTYIFVCFDWCWNVHFEST